MINTGTHPASYPIGTRGFFPGGKRPARKADQSPPSSSEVKNAWNYTFTPQYAFVAWWSVKAEGQLYFMSVSHELKLLDFVSFSLKI
jgi:hypothetical protein